MSPALWSLDAARRWPMACAAGAHTARASVEQCLARIDATDQRVNAFTSVLGERALRNADRIDRHTRRSELPLAGVPFAVKNLFDIAGLPTLAGSKIERDAAPAARDALLVRRLEAAGAVLVGALNMDEYAYGFTTENTHYGVTRNPTTWSDCPVARRAARVPRSQRARVPLTLGSDTNGSIRVPSSLCGVFGLKPTYGRLPRTGSYPFVTRASTCWARSPGVPATWRSRTTRCRAPLHPTPPASAGRSSRSRRC